MSFADKDKQYGKTDLSYKKRMDVNWAEKIIAIRGQSEFANKVEQWECLKQQKWQRSTDENETLDSKKERKKTAESNGATIKPILPIFDGTGCAERLQNDT